MKKINMLVVASMFVMIISGCYRNNQVSESQIALLMPKGNAVESVVGPGKYTDMSYWSDIQVIDVSSKIFEWSNDDLVTSDKQVIGLSIVVTVQRGRDDEFARIMWSQYNREALDDEALKTLVFSRLSRTAKNATAQYSLDEMLGTNIVNTQVVSQTNSSGDETGRNQLTSFISNELERSLAKAGVLLIDVGVNDINPSASYRESLDRKAKATADTEVIKQQTVQKQQELLQEQAQTKIELEKASRQRQVAEENAKVLAESDETYEIERLKVIMNGLSNKDKIFFIQPGQDISLFLNGDVPVVEAPSEQGE